MVKQLLDDTEQVDVSVVDREVQGHESGAAANPESLHKLPEDPPGFVPSRGKILDRSSSTVGWQVAPKIVTAQFFCSLIAPSV